MQEIEEGEFFPLNTSNRKEAMKKVLETVKSGPTDTGELVQKLYEEDIYSQKKDCKDFIKNLVNSSNHRVQKHGRRYIGLPNEKEVVHP